MGRTTANDGASPGAGSDHHAGPAAGAAALATATGAPRCGSTVADRPPAGAAAAFPTDNAGTWADRDGGKRDQR